MDTEIAQKRVNDLATSMAAKGMAMPEATLMLKAEAQPCIHMSWRDESERYDRAYHAFHHDTIVEAFDAANEFIANRPSAEQAKKDEFLAALGKVIDLGKRNGVEVEFLNPLVASMKKLSENVITHQRKAS